MFSGRFWPVSAVDGIVLPALNLVLLNTHSRLYCMVLHGIVLHCMVLHWNVLYSVLLNIHRLDVCSENFIVALVPHQMYRWVCFVYVTVGIGGWVLYMYLWVLVVGFCTLEHFGAVEPQRGIRHCQREIKLNGQKLANQPYSPPSRSKIQKRTSSILHAAPLQGFNISQAGISNLNGYRSWPCCWYTPTETESHNI